MAADEVMTEPMALASVVLATVAHSDPANVRRLTLRILARASLPAMVECI